MNVFQTLLNYFQNIADSLGGGEPAGGNDRSGQDALVDFLVSRLPKSCHVVKGGYVFDSSGDVSKPVDIIVTGDLAIRFTDSDSSYCCLEGCYSAICVSRLLDRNACTRSLETLASIPLTPETPPGLEFLFGSKSKGVLARAIFSLEGPGPEETLEHIEEYYQANQVPDHAKANLIIVNNRYGIVRTGEQGAVAANGAEIPANSFHIFGCSSSEPCIGGYSLMYLLTEVQRAVATAQTSIDYGAYLDELPL